MAKIAIMIFSDTDSAEAMGKLSGAFVLAEEAIESGDELRIIFQGAGARWIGELEIPDHKLHIAYQQLKPHISGVCAFCAEAFGVSSQVEKAGVGLLSEYKNHPSLRKLIADGFQIIIF